MFIINVYNQIIMHHLIMYLLIYILFSYIGR